MTKKKIKDFQLKSIFEAIKLIYNVTEDFADIEGHGYFTFQITENNIQYNFDLDRNKFYIIGHKLKNDVNYEQQTNIEISLEFMIRQIIDYSNTLLNVIK